MAETAHLTALSSLVPPLVGFLSVCVSVCSTKHVRAHICLCSMLQSASTQPVTDYPSTAMLPFASLPLAPDSDVDHVG